MKYGSKTFQENYETALIAAEKQVRDKMKEMVSRCSIGEQDLFRRIYNPKKLEGDVVDMIPFEKLDWACCQLEKALHPQRIVERYLNGEDPDER